MFMDGHGLTCVRNRAFAFAFAGSVCLLVVRGWRRGTWSGGSVGVAAAIAHGVESAREVRLNTPVAEVCASLLNALDLALDTPAIALLGEAAEIGRAHV